MSTAYVALETGDVLSGRSRSPGATTGELVFTTAYSGYEESLTDPSYAKQILTFAYPLIGNYGVRDERFESDRVQPEAAIAREFTDDVADWLHANDVPAVDHLDTREIVLTVREYGAMKCGIAAGPNATPEQAKAQLRDCKEMSEHTDIGATVSTTAPCRYVGNTATDTPDNLCVALIDCGVKHSIIDSLCDRGATVYRLPYDTTTETVDLIDPDLLFISNGPGDPEHFLQAQHLVDEYAGQLPIAGICLGQQIVALALGGSTTKMEFGHRGVNQPVYDRATERVVMTTQNHGYTVADPGPLEVTQHNINDESAEGLAHPSLPILTRQYHPEAHPGPHDTLDFFDDVLTMAQTARETSAGQDQEEHDTEQSEAITV